MKRYGETWREAFFKAEAEVERLKARPMTVAPAQAGTSEYIRELQAEVERLKARVFELRGADLGYDFEHKWAIRMEEERDDALARIEAALKKSDHTLDEACVGCRDLSGVIREMVKALKGGRE